MDVKNSQQATLGLQGIITQFVRFFNHSEKTLRSGDDKNRRKLLQQLERQVTIGKKLAVKANVLTQDIEKMLSKVVEVIASTNVLDDKFNAAKSGLKGASELSEEATLQIGETAEQLQTSLQDSKVVLEEALKDLEMPEESRAKIDEQLAKLESMGDDAFNIAVALQFQDILRQQLSAIATIMSNTKNQLAETMNKLTGSDLEVADDEELVSTDDSILTMGEGGSQDDIDALINSTKSD
jgi:hypothetical protein